MGQLLRCLSKHSPQGWEAGGQQLKSRSGKILQLPKNLEHLVFVWFPPAILEVQIHPRGSIHLPTLLPSPVPEERDALDANCLLTALSFSSVHTMPSSMMDAVILLFIPYSYFIKPKRGVNTISAEL